MNLFATAGLMDGLINLMMNHGYKGLPREEQEVFGLKEIQIILIGLHYLEK